MDSNTYEFKMRHYIRFIELLGDKLDAIAKACEDHNSACRQFLDSLRLAGNSFGDSLDEIACISREIEGMKRTQKDLSSMIDFEIKLAQLYRIEKQRQQP